MNTQSDREFRLWAEHLRKRPPSEWQRFKALTPRGQMKFLLFALYGPAQEIILRVFDPVMRLNQYARYYGRSAHVRPLCLTCTYPERLAEYQRRVKWTFGIYGRFVGEPPVPAKSPCPSHGSPRKGAVILRRGYRNIHNN